MQLLDNGALQMRHNGHNWRGITGDLLHKNAKKIQNRLVT